MPIQWDKFDLRNATDEELASVQFGKPGKVPDAHISALMDEIASGKTKTFPVTADNEADIRGLRIALGRAAAQRGFKLEYGTKDSELYIRKSDEPLRPKSPKQSGGEGNGRRGPGRPRNGQPTPGELLSEGMSETME